MKEVLIVTEEGRLDNYLSDMFENISRSHFQKLIKSGKVLVNGKEQKPSYTVQIKDKIEFEDIEETEILPQNIPLDVIYEDENMLVVNKPSNMLTHLTANEKENTLVNALLYYCGENNLSNINGNYRRGIVHRLDRNTSGLLMVAKNNKTHEYLANLIRNRLVTKKYLAIVKGVLKDDFGLIDKPIGRNVKHPEKMAIVEGGKDSITEFRVIERFKDCTYLELNLKTGRTHQIRVHLSSIGHPIMNDSLYGGGGFKIKTQEQVLQSYKLEFAKPFDGDIITLCLEPDEDIKKALRFLRAN